MQTTNRRSIRVAALALALLMAVGLLSGCQATITNPVVGKVGDVEITYSQFYNTYNMYKQYYGYGVSASASIGTGTETDQNQKVKDMVWEMLINSALLLDQAKKQGVTLTEEEIAEVEADLEEQSHSLVHEYMPEDVEDTDPNYEEYYKEAMKTLEASLKQGGYTYKSYVEQVREELMDQKISDKFTEQLESAVTVDEAQVKETYDNALKQAQEDYAKDVSLYYEDNMAVSYYGGVPPVYIPEGYYYVKHILVANAKEGEEKDVDAIVAEIEQKLEAGEDFDALMNQYSEDTGLATNPNGYLFCAAIADKYYAEFSAAAEKLLKKGDMSEPVTSTAGVHILMRGDDLESRVVPEEEVHDAIYNQLLTNAKNEMMETTLEGWLAETKVEKYENRVQYVGVE